MHALCLRSSFSVVCVRVCTRTRTRYPGLKHGTQSSPHPSCVGLDDTSEWFISGHTQYMQFVASLDTPHLPRVVTHMHMLVHCDTQAHTGGKSRTAPSPTTCRRRCVLRADAKLALAPLPHSASLWAPCAWDTGMTRHGFTHTSHLNRVRRRCKTLSIRYTHVHVASTPNHSHSSYYDFACAHVWCYM